MVNPPTNVPAINPWPEFLSQCSGHLAAVTTIRAEGRLTRVAGLVMEAVGLRLPVGSTCLVSQDGMNPVEAEVVGFAGKKLFLMPTTDVFGLTPGAAVVPADSHVARPKPGRSNHPWRRAEDRTKHLPVGAGLLGRVLDAQGRPLDSLGALDMQAKVPLSSRPLNPIDRIPISQPLDTGVRAINALLTVGRGQRMGLFAGSGVGKSVLLGMMARYTNADVTVVGLIGERGREVKEFIEESLGDDGLARAVVIAAPADVPPLLRMQGAAYATTIAEYFRDQGKNVLLIMDSLTRYAMAQREIALAIGEPPATRGYPPSCFAKMPQLVERSGNGQGKDSGQGSITAFYTVLTEGDDPQDPIADAARGILDGHIVLSRELAEAGHYPAIDIERSISRVMPAVTPRPQQQAARRMRQLLAKLSKARDLLQLGAYQPGNDADLDAAVQLQPQMMALLQQDMHERAALDECRARLLHLLPAT